MRISDWSSDVCSSDLAEVEQDIEHGLLTKTAIHPDQISVIHSVYRPEIHEMNEARAILSQEAPAVFGRNGSMCEPATHAPWAGMIIRGSQAHGFPETAEQAEGLVSGTKTDRKRKR